MYWISKIIQINFICKVISIWILHVQFYTLYQKNSLPNIYHALKLTFVLPRRHWLVNTTRLETGTFDSSLDFVFDFLTFKLKIFCSSLVPFYYTYSPRIYTWIIQSAQNLKELGTFRLYGKYCDLYLIWFLWLSYRIELAKKKSDHDQKLALDYAFINRFIRFVDREVVRFSFIYIS